MIILFGSLYLTFLSDIKLNLSNFTSKRSQVAVCFFGISRNLSLSLPGINENIFQALEENGYSERVFLHTFSNDRV